VSPGGFKSHQDSPRQSAHFGQPTKHNCCHPHRTPDALHNPEALFPTLATPIDTMQPLGKTNSDLHLQSFQTAKLTDPPTPPATELPIGRNGSREAITIAVAMLRRPENLHHEPAHKASALEMLRMSSVDASCIVSWCPKRMCMSLEDALGRTY
jgi:hypothetical protein